MTPARGGIVKSRVPIVALVIVFVMELVDVSLRIAGGGVPWLGIGVLALVALGIGWLVMRKPG